MIDSIKITVKGGEGGSGVVSFRREKFVPFGGPNGGDGGHGGSIWLQATPELSTLALFRFKHRFVASRGGHGQGDKRKGKAGLDLTLRVPLGTEVWEMKERTSLLADLSQPGDRVLVAKGGRGGWGNTHFATPTEQVPRFALKGEPGEERQLRLELKLLAEIGIIGYPNVGKSTLLTAISSARPKIANYPFTTLEPVLGVVKVGYDSFVVADIPGLIEGASQGKGLGDAFLRHIERTRLLIHLLDGTSSVPRSDWEVVNRELALSQPSLAAKPQIVALNKMDLPQVKERQEVLKEELGLHNLLFISAATGEGVASLMATAWGQLQALRAQSFGGEAGARVFRPQLQAPLTVQRQDSIFIVSGRGVERLILMADLAQPEARRHVKAFLARMGIANALLKAGVKPGDRVRLGEVEMEWE